MFGTFRALLALMVVASHLADVRWIGFYAVFGFYILSGYLMTLIMQMNYGYTASGVFKYALNRFLRIYPTYWLSIAVSALLIWRLGSEFVQDYHASIFLPRNLSELSKNLALYLIPGKDPRLTPPAWALTFELFFYLLIGLGISRNKRWTVAWFAISIVYHISLAVRQYGWFHRYYTIPASSLPFATGAMIFHFKPALTQWVEPVKGKLGSFLPYLLGFALLANWGVGRHVDRSGGIFFYSNYVLCALLVVVLADSKTLPYLDKKVDKWMGELSYPIYLFHYQVGLVVIAVANTAGVSLKRPDVGLMFVSVPLTFVCAWIVVVVMERPIQRLRAVVKKRQPTSK